MCRNRKITKFLLTFIILGIVTSVTVLTTSATLAQENTISKYVGQLKYKEASARAYAAYVLGEIGDASTVKSLIPLLNDEDKYVRAITAKALGKIGDVKAVEALTNALKDKERTVRLNAANALKKISPNKQYEITRYVEDLDVKDSSVRIEAAQKLSKLVPEKAQQYQITRYINDLKDSDMQIRASAANALGKIGDMKAVQPLTTALNDNKALVRKNAVSALGQIVLRLEDATVVKPALKTLISLLQDKSKMVSASAATTLAEIGDIAVEPLTNAAKGDNASVRATAVTILGKIHPENLQEYQLSRYTKELKVQDASIRANAAIKLGMIGDKRAVNPLIDALKDVDRSVRQNAIDALVKIGEPAIRPLISLLKGQDTSVQLHAAVALREIGLKLRDKSKLSPAKDVLVKAFVNTDSPIHSIATQILRQMGSYAVDSLTTLLSDKDDATRAIATAMLTEIQPQKAKDYKIMRYMNDLDSPDVSVRSNAANALGMYGESSAVVGRLVNLFGDSNDSVRRSASNALERIGSSAIKSLIPLLTDDNRYTRQYAFTTLAKIAPQAKVDELQPSITAAIKGLGDLDSSIRSAGEKILVNIGEPAISPLIGLFKNSSGAQARHQARAIRILKQIGNPAIESLKSALNDQNSIVRKNAAIALTQIDPDNAEQYQITRYIADLNDADAETRRIAAFRLGRTNNQNAVEPLIAALNDKDFRVRANAADGLAYLADRRALEPLKRVEDDDKVDMVKRVAKESLERIDRLPEND